MAGARASARLGRLIEFGQILAGVVRSQRLGVRRCRHEATLSRFSRASGRLSAPRTRRRPARSSTSACCAAAPRATKPDTVSGRGNGGLPIADVRSGSPFFAHRQLRLEDSAVTARRTLARLRQLSWSKTNPHPRQRAGSTTMSWPAARADRIMWRSASSTSARGSPSSRARLDTDRGWSRGTRADLRAASSPHQPRRPLSTQSNLPSLRARRSLRLKALHHFACMPEPEQPPLQNRRRTIERAAEGLHRGQHDAGVERVVGVDLRLSCTPRTLKLRFSRTSS